MTSRPAGFDNFLLSRETGAGPRGDRSRFIETDSGVVQSKYRYMGFGLWENLDPAAPKKPKKKSPPPPPPKVRVSISPYEITFLTSPITPGGAHHVQLHGESV